VGGVAFEGTTVPVVDGSRLLLYTDGLVESRDSDLDDGMAALLKAFRDGVAPLDPLCDLLLAATGRDDGHHDDVALLVAELSGLTADRVATWRLSGGGETVSDARAWVCSRLAAWGLPGLAESAELLAGELVTNALRHASGPIVLHVLLLDEMVTLAVHDSEAPLPRLRKVRDGDEGGRGLQLVASMSSRWGARPTATGKVVWCDLPRPRT
jgi:hypothetical protein